MRKISTLLVFCIAFVFAAKAQLFTISSISPTSAAPGAAVTMTVTASAGTTFSTSSTGCTCPTCVQVSTGNFFGITFSSSSTTINATYSVTSASNNTCVFTFTVPSTQVAGMYNLSFTGLNTCAALKSNAFTVTGGTTGISTVENSNFNVFPNPSKGIFDVQLNNFTATNFADVFDLLGRKVETFTLTSEKTQLDASRFGKGVYFISIRNENGIVGRQKLVIE